MSPTVLLVAEDSLFLESLSGSLKRFKASVLSAESKHEALETCSNHEVDLALLDIRQQGSDAMQVLARLKKNQPDTEIILLSDPKTVALAMEGMQQGASDDITAPFDIDLLKRKVTNALKRRNARLRAREIDNSDNDDIRLKEKVKVG